MKDFKMNLTTENNTEAITFLYLIEKVLRS